jgi:hypothetical protein
MAPKRTKSEDRRGADPAQEARRCHQRLEQSGRPAARAMLGAELDDWLALAAHERARRIETFRASPNPPTAEETHQPQRAGRFGAG